MKYGLGQSGWNAPEYEPLDDPMRRPAPGGYRLPRLSEAVGFAYVCVVCGANVSPSATDLHIEWHQRH